MTVTEACADRRVAGGFEHLAVFYRGGEGLVDAVLPFVREGIERREPVLVALLAERLAAVEAALGADATRVDFVDMGELGSNPACIIPEWRRFLADADEGKPVRGVAEPVWRGRREPEIDEAVLHEALLNLAFGDGPSWQLLCPYDASALPASVLEQAARTHPCSLPATGRPAPGAAYAGAVQAVETFATPLPSPPEGADAWEFGPHDLPGLRSLVDRSATFAGIARGCVDDLVLAAHELATNSILHGGGKGVLRSWVEPDAFVVEVADTGRILDPLVGRELLEDMAENGRGVWMANQLCALVQVRSGEHGTVVRLRAWC